MYNNMILKLVSYWPDVDLYTNHFIVANNGTSSGNDIGNDIGNDSGSNDVSIRYDALNTRPLLLINNAINYATKCRYRHVYMYTHVCC